MEGSTSTLTVRSQAALPPIQLPSHPASPTKPTKNETFRTNFARIDTDGSDNTIDDKNRSPSPPQLGKRDRTSPSKEDQTNLRRNRPVSPSLIHRLLSDHCPAEESGELQAGSSGGGGKYDQKADFSSLFAVA